MADIAVKGVIETNVALTGLFTTADGVPILDGDYMLLVGQTSPVQNGVWVAHNDAWTRTEESLDYRKGFEVRVLEGANHELSLWLQITSGTILLDTTPLLWQKESIGKVYTPGEGVQLQGTQIALAPSGVLPGSYSLASLQVNSVGQVVSASAGDSGASYIEGLEITTGGGTDFYVKPGAAFIPSNNRVIKLASLFQGVTEAINDCVYIYLYETNGVGQIEMSYTEPGNEYIGTARTKYGDMSRRFIGMLRVTPDGWFIPFDYTSMGGSVYKVTYDWGDGDPLLKFADITGTSANVNVLDDISLSSVYDVDPAIRFLPPGVKEALIYWETTGTGNKYIGHYGIYAGGGGADNFPPHKLKPASSGKDLVTLDDSNNLWYTITTVGDNMKLYLSGYVGRR